MKKLMIALAAAATTMFSFGDVTLPTGTSFEDLTEGPVDVGGVVNKDDSGNPSGSEFYWYSTAPATDELGAITTDVALASLNLGRPDMFSGNQTKSLFIDTTAPLVRTALPNNSGVQPVAIGNDGIYLDTLVKFTAADEAFAENLTDGDKIAIEYVEHEAEEGDAGYTNFVVRAGLIVGTGLSQQIEQTNYVAAVPAGFDKNEWHRLTVRTIADVGDGNVGFVIYLDGDVNKTLEYSKDVDAGFGTLGAVAEKFYNSEKHALFPSAIAAGATGGSTISSVAFSGNGFIDDVSFAAEAPNFIKAGEAVVATFVADAGVTAISVSVAGVAEPISVVNGSATLPAQTTAFTVNVTVDEANGYTFGSMTVGDAVYNTNPASVTGYTGGDITITTTRNNFNLFDANGDPISGTYQTLSEAFAASGVATIKLAYDYDVTDWGETLSDSSPVYNLTKDVVLDLNGKTLNGGGSDTRFLFSTAIDKMLTVIDSVSGDTGKIIYSGAYGIFGGEGDTYLGSNAMTDYGPVIDGAICGEQGWVTEVVRGKFSAADNTGTWDPDIGESGGISDPNGFVSQLFLAQGSSSELVSGYWVVSTGAQPPAPTQVAVPEALIGIMYDGTLKTGVVENVGYTLTGNTGTDAGSYEATATLAAGHIWSDNSTTNKTISWGILPNNQAEVVVTLTSEIAEYSAQLEFPTASATIGGDDVAGTPAWDPATISEPEAGATNTYTVTFTVTTANYAGSTGTAEFKVYKSAGGGSNWPAGWNGGTEPASMVTAFNTWIAAGNDPTAANAEAAFLVGVDVDDYTEDLAVASISIVGGNVVITGNYNLSSVNGALSVKMGNAPNALTTTTAVTAAEGAISLTPALGETKKFYQLVIGYPAN